MIFCKRVELVLLFDVVHGNPNGDPDAGNAPRVDPETGLGIVTDVCLKRKLRNFVALVKGYEPPYDIYVKERGILAREQKKAYQAIKCEPTNRPNADARRWMCENYFDVRAFGAVMTTGKTGAYRADAELDSKETRTARRDQKLWNCGQVRGPVQLGFSRSQSPVFTHEHTIARVALTNEDDTGHAPQAGAEDQPAGSGQMGRKHTIPYALYRGHVFISPFLAENTGFSQQDYELLLEALANMFEHDRSSSRGEMSLQGLGLFEHDSPLGNAPAHRLFESIRVEGPEVPRCFSDYRISGPGHVPKGVSFRWVVGPGLNQ